MLVLLGTLSNRNSIISYKYHLDYTSVHEKLYPPGTKGITSAPESRKHRQKIDIQGGKELQSLDSYVRRKIKKISFKIILIPRFFAKAYQCLPPIKSL